MKIEDLSDKHKKLLVKDHSFIMNDDLGYYTCSVCNLQVIIKNQRFYILNAYYTLSKHASYKSSNFWIEHIADGIYDLKEDRVRKQRLCELVLSHDEKLIKNIII